MSDRSDQTNASLSQAVDGVLKSLSAKRAQPDWREGLLALAFR